MCFVRCVRKGNDAGVGQEVKEEEDDDLDYKARCDERILERGSDLHLVVKATARNLR